MADELRARNATLQLRLLRVAKKAEVARRENIPVHPEERRLAARLRKLEHDALAPRFELSNRSMAVVDFAGDDGRPRVEVATVATAPEGLGRLVASLAAHDHARAAVMLAIVVVLVATGLVLKLYEAFNGVGGDIADQIHGDVTPDS